jgi:hypothetical protein
MLIDRARLPHHHVVQIGGKYGERQFTGFQILS